MVIDLRTLIGNAMKAIHGFALIAIVVGAIVFSGLGFFLAIGDAYAKPDNARREPPESVDVNLFGNLPASVAGNEIQDFNDIAWRTFVTLNWPADPEGKPIKDEAFGKNPNAPRMWEFYITPEETFLPKDKHDQYPNPDNPDQIARFCQNSSVQKKTIPLSLAEGENFKLDNNRQLQRSSDSFLDFPHSFGLGYPLVDQKGDYILLETHLNPAECEQIVQNQWYKREVLKHYNSSTKFQFSSTNLEDAPVEIKVAWQVSNGVDDKKYYTTKRELVIPKDRYICTDENSCKEKCVNQVCRQSVNVRLIGFHIMYKIPDQTKKMPGWIFATFEHDDNLKNLSNEVCKTNCYPNHPFVKEPYWSDRPPHAVTKVNEQVEAAIPTQVQRVVREYDKVANATLQDLTRPPGGSQNPGLNYLWKKKFEGSIWQNYKPIGVQWLSDPTKSKVVPGKLLNVTMEPYPKFGTSCMECHIHATLPSGSDSDHIAADFSFLLQYAQ